MIVGLLPEDVPLIRAQLEGIAARSRGVWTANGLAEGIAGHDRQAWAYIDGGETLAVMLTHVTAEAIHIDAATGRGRGRWARDFIDIAEQGARELGKRYVIANTRPGWTPEMRAMGFRESHREFVREVG